VLLAGAAGVTREGKMELTEILSPTINAAQVCPVVFFFVVQTLMEVSIVCGEVDHKALNSKATRIQVGE
jgi:hypothetical protein